jgi:hypothetical protein
LDAETLRKLDQASVYSIRGDLRSASEVIGQVFIQLEESELGLDSVTGVGSKWSEGE